MRASTIVVLTCLCVFAGSVSANSQGAPRQTIQASEQSSSSSSSSSQQSSNSENSSSRTETGGSSGKTVKSAEQSRSSNNAAAQQSSNSENSSSRTETDSSSGKTVKSSEQSRSSNNAAAQQSSNSENSSSRTETDGSSGKTSQSSQTSSSSNQAASQQSSSSSSSSTEIRKVDVETAWNKLSKEERAAFQKWLTTKDKRANVDEFDDDDDIKGALIRYRKRFPVAINKGDKGIELNFNLKTLMYSDLKSGDNQCICSCKNSKKPYFINVDQQKAED